VPAPATTGPPAWERLNRIHVNSVEQFVVFSPLLWSFALYVGQRGAAMLGTLYLIARIVYAVGYARAPESRTLGAALTFAVQAILAVGAIVGIVVQMARLES
jgi:glutathione S-transferase